MTADVTDSVPPLAGVLTALHTSHERMVSVLAPLSADEVDGPSYDDDWTVAQVASHLGSGADIFLLMLEAGLQGLSAPGVDAMKPLWETWNAKSTADQAADSVASNAAFLARLDALTPDERSGWSLELFGSRQTLAGLLRLRLTEHAIHVWDIAVIAEPAATIASDAVELIIDALPWTVERAVKGTGTSILVSVTTTQPDRRFVLDVTADGASLTPSDGAVVTSAGLRLTGETFIRLVYGRLDPDHTPVDVETDGTDLDTLRAIFPGV